ncbi:MAG: sel1 repeat family protein [Moraxellaceae bacterium]|nr:sel1 repeat family protein [Moraxellaceae bacterium]
MKNLMAVVLLCAASVSYAGLYEGAAAYQKGDYAAALKEFNEAAEQGHADAQFNLGLMYRKGQGVPQDDTQAVVWFKKAAQQGYASAQYNLGIMYDKGQGVPQDYTQAVVWWQKAAQQGIADAQYNLGSLSLYTTIFISL